MSKAYAEVIWANGGTERFGLTSSELILGRSTKAGISLPGEAGLELEHLLLVPGGDAGCWVSVAQHADDVELDGAPFRAGLVPWGAEIRVVHLRVCLRKRSDAVRPWAGRGLYLGVMVLLAAGSWLLLSEGSTSVTGAASADLHPSLFFDLGRCPDVEEFVEQGRELERRASSHVVRYAYEPADGVKAVLRLQEAAACYANAGDSAAAARLRARVDTLRQRIEADYAALRLRLDDAIERGRWAEVARAARQLRRLMTHLEGNDYVQWLQSIEAQAAAKL
jgi:hypothetical protein